MASTLPSDIAEVIVSLNTIAKEDVKEIYHSQDVYEVTVQGLCDAILSAVEYCATLSQFPNEESFTKFCKRTLPVLVDVLLRRRTKRYIDVALLC